MCILLVDTEQASTAHGRRTNKQEFINGAGGCGVVCRNAQLVYDHKDVTVRKHINMSCSRARSLEAEGFGG